MAWYDRILGRQTQPAPAPEVKHAPPSREALEQIAIRLKDISTTGPMTDSQRIDFIEGHPVAYWCVRKIASAVSSVRWRVVDEKGQLIHDDPISQRLNNPNPRQSRSDLFQVVASSLATTGNAYLLPVNSEREEGMPVGIYALRPDRMDIRTKARDTTQVESYAYNTGGGSKVYAPDEICHVRHTWVGKDEKGYAPIDSVWESAKIYSGFVRLARKVLENSGGIPGALVFSGQTELSEEQRTNLREHIQSFRLDGEKFGELLLLDAFSGSVNFIPLAGDLNKLQPREGKLDVAREVCLAFGVPPLLYTSSSLGPTYSNYQESNRSFWVDTIIPGYISNIESALSRYFTNATGAIVEVKADLSAVPALSKVNSEAVANLTRLTGILEVNEQREQLGFGPHPMGNRIVVNPAAIALDTQLAVSDANAVLSTPPELLTAILEADPATREIIGKALTLLKDGASEDSIKAQFADLASSAKPMRNGSTNVAPS